ncbi:hypothetical protein BGX23_002651 [Mortierella sp. AD031]|nr:hypothetical protein BGX23_002651 [Mortierella sp. AD031]
MSATLYLNWALNIEPKKEHVSFVNFVRKFDFTNRNVAHEAYSSLLESQHIRQCRRKRLHEAYNSFRARNEEGFWAERALLVNSAIAAKKSAVMIQEAGLQEADSGLHRYPSDLNSNATHLNIEAETEAYVNSEVVARKNTAPASKDDHGEDLDDTEEVDDMYNDNPSEGIDPASDTNAVDDVSQAADGGALDNVDVAAPGYAYPITTLKDLEREPGPTFARSSLQRRHSALGSKWLLESGTVVEDVLLQAGLGLSVDHPICSFMVDLQDKYTKSLFSPQDWVEINSNLPASAAYSTEAAEYLDALEDIVQEQDIISVLDSRPRDPDKAIVHRCAESWCDLFGMDPSPFVLESVLSEDWWMNNAWSGARLLAKAVPGSYIITGEATGIDSTSRRNNKERYINIAPQNNRKKMGVRADMIWRTLEAPVRDWMIGEAARQWDENAGKYGRLCSV